MSDRRKLERAIARAGARSGGGTVGVSELRAEANQLAKQLIEVTFARQPVNPLAALLALEVTRRHVVALVDESDESEESKARFWESVRSELDAYDTMLKARRS